MDDHRLEERALNLDLRIGEGFQAAHFLGVPPLDRIGWLERQGAELSAVEEAVRVRAVGLSITDLESLRSRAVRQLESALGIGEEHIVIDLEASTSRLGKLREALAEGRAQLGQAEGSARNILSEIVPSSVLAGLSVRKDAVSWGGLLDRGLERVKRATAEAGDTLIELRVAVRRIEAIEHILQGGTDVENMAVKAAVPSGCLAQPKNPFYSLTNEVIFSPPGCSGRGGERQGLWQVIGPWVLNRMAYHQEHASGFERIASLITKDIIFIVTAEENCELSKSEMQVVEEMSGGTLGYYSSLNSDQLLRIRKDHNEGLFGDPLRPEKA